MRIHSRACRCRRRDRHQSKQLLAPSGAGSTNAGSNDAIAISAGSVYDLLGRNPPVSDTASEHSHVPDYDVPGCFNFARCPQTF